MPDDPQKAELSPQIPTRDAAGQFVTGTAPPNPTGANGLKGYARVEARIDHFLDQYTFKQIKDMVSKDSGLDNFTGRDAQILIHIARTLTGKEVGKERERMYDRQYGKAIQTIKLSDDRPPTPSDIAAISDEEAARLYEQSLKE